MTNVRAISEFAKVALAFAEAIATRVFTNTEHLQNKAVYFTGEGPFLISDLAELLPQGIRCGVIDENPPDNYNEPPTACIVVGRDRFDEDAILDCIKKARITPAFLPQEGFLDLVLFGYDWWNDFCETLTELDKSLEYHEGLQYVHALQRTGFEWPAVESATSVEPGDSLRTFRSESPLLQAGYRIRGDRGSKIPRAQRWLKLASILDGNQLSLQEVTETIAGLVRVRKLREDGRDLFWYAIQEWEHDLARLKREYYDRSNYAFQWPNSD